MKVKIMPENFVAFFTVCGFFVGLTFSVISIDGAFEIIVFTVLITFLFYMLIHISIMTFIDKEKPLARIFNKEEYEMINEVLITDLEKRVNKADHLMEALAQEREEIKKSEAKEKRRKNGIKNVA